MTSLLLNEALRLAIAFTIHNGYECPTYVHQLDNDEGVIAVTYKEGKQYRILIKFSNQKPYIASFEEVSE